MELSYYSSAQIAEMASQFPASTQVGVCLTDYMRDQTPNSVEDRANLKVDPALFCAYAQPRFIPHNQVLGNGGSGSGSGATGSLGSGSGTGSGSGSGTGSGTGFSGAFSGSGSGSGSVPSIVDLGVYVRSGLPSVVWNSVVCSGPYVVQEFAARPWSFSHWDVLCTNEANQDSMSVSASCTLGGQGFIAMLSRNHWQFIDPASTTTSTWQVDWSMAAGIYRVRGGSGQQATLMFSDDNGVTFNVLNAKLKVADTPLKSFGNARPDDNSSLLTVEVLCMNSKMTVAIGGGAGVMTVQIPGDAVPYPTISTVTVTAQNFTQFGWSVHPFKFYTSASMTSGQKQLGFVPDALHYILTGLVQGYTAESGGNYTENGGTVTVNTAILSSQPQYSLTLANPNNGSYENVSYSNTTVAISRVALRTNAKSRVYPYTPSPIIPQQVIQNISFDPNSLTVSHSLEMVLDNYTGIDDLFNNYGIRGYGNLGVSFRCGWNHMPDGPDGGTGWQRFYGFCNQYRFTRGPGGEAKLIMSCVDQMQQMAEVQISAPPDFDGWNHYSAMAYLWMYGGVTAPQLAFADMVPTLGGGTLLSNPGAPIDPFGVSDNDPTPGGYYLPYGIGMHPWTPRDRTMSVGALMDFLRKTSGYLNYIDAYGFARYEPWIPPSQVPVTRIFGEVADDGYGYPGGAVNEIFSMSAGCGTVNTRNQTIVIGIDAYGQEWAPIVEVRTDEASIFTDPYTTPPRNYKGYPATAIWTDARFANEEYASAAADYMHAINTLPDYDVTIDTWMQPDIFPMQSIMVDDWKSNSLGVPFYITNVRLVQSVLSGNLELKSTITGKFLL